MRCFLPAKLAICKLTYPHLHANRLFSLWRLQKALHEPELAPTTALDDFCRALAAVKKAPRRNVVLLASFDFAAIRVRISLARPVVVTLTPADARDEC